MWREIHANTQFIDISTVKDKINVVKESSTSSLILTSITEPSWANT